MNDYPINLDYFLTVLDVTICERDGNLVAVTAYGYDQTQVSKTLEVILYGKASI